MGEDNMFRNKKNSEKSERKKESFNQKQQKEVGKKKKRSFVNGGKL